MRKSAALSRDDRKHSECCSFLQVECRQGRIMDLDWFVLLILRMFVPTPQLTGRALAHNLRL
jgi:hypothetical protein